VRGKYRFTQFPESITGKKYVLYLPYNIDKGLYMNRAKFIAAALVLYPITILGKFKLAQVKDGTRSGKGFKVKAGTARFGVSYKMKGVTQNNLDIKISSKDTNGDLAVFEQTGYTPKGGPPMHIHPHQDEWFYIVEGEYLFQAGEERYDMKKGDTIFLPRNVKHAFIQKTDNGKVIVSYMPAGKMEDFFKAADALVTPLSKAEMEKLFEEHDMKVVGPPLNAD
jgi:quercetin dioxygenase-like cupin family protein